MKKIIYMLAILSMLIAPSVIAYEGMEIEWIKFYVNGERKSGADEEGGDFNVYAGDEVRMITKFYNHNDTMTEVKMEAIIENIDDGDDLEKDHDWFDVDEDDDKSKEFTFLIPDDAMKDDYEMTLEITYKYNNGTQEELDTIDWEISVRDEDTSSSTKIDLESSFDNLTNMCGDFMVNLNTCFGYVNKSDDCVIELGDCKEERGSCTSDRDTFEKDNINCNKETTNLKLSVQEKESEIKNMITPLICKEKVDEKEKDMQQLGLILGLIGVGGFMLWKKKQEGQDVDKQYYKDQ